MSLATELAGAAKRHPDRVFLRTAEGELTYDQTDRAAALTAAGLAALGVRAGEPVVLLMHNSLDQLTTWFALSRLGAVHVPINTALVGSTLAHAFRVTGAALAVVDTDLLPALLAVRAELPALRQIVVRGAADAEFPDLTDLQTCRLTTSPPAVVDDLSTATVLFTSGTTGVSKGCALSHRYLLRQGELHATSLRLRPDDVLYAPFPLFHIDAATLTVVAALVVGATAAIGRRFSASRFWDEARAFEATVFNFLGATLSILWKQPPVDRDRDHRVRLAWGVPMPTWRHEWEQRFGFRLCEVYGLTDAGVPVYEPLDEPPRPGSCGRVIPQFDVIVAGDDDRPVPPGSEGQILVRGREPGLVMNGYWAMPRETAAALRGGWFHTGDLGHLDADGHLYFHGRGEDSIRRRGENISAHEVETIIGSHPSVLEVAAVGVASELTEQDLKVCVVLRPGRQLVPEDIIEYCADHAPAHMVPRYVEIMRALPKTPTQKIEKFRLSRTSNRTWDRDQSPDLLVSRYSTGGRRTT